MPRPDGEGNELGVTDELAIYRRYLPHWEAGGSTYFLTFRLYGTYPRADGGSSATTPLSALVPKERDIVMRTILFWHSKRWFVHALVVMPDHVHILAQPLERSPGVWHPLRHLLHSVKRTTAWEINRLRGRQGPLWQSERADRAARSESECYQKAAYILENAQGRGLVENGWEYQWFWCPGKEQLRSRFRRE
jgi:REP element-mobilizing transposase RayT